MCPEVFRGGGFREKVWQRIYRELGVGETATYGDIAARCGSHGASQAVGTAMRTNPVRKVIKIQTWESKNVEFLMLLLSNYQLNLI